MVSYILHINVCAKVVFDSVISVGDTEDSLICPSFVCIIITRAWSSPLCWSSVFSYVGLSKFGTKVQ